MPAIRKNREKATSKHSIRGPALITYVRPKDYTWKQIPIQIVMAEAMGIAAEQLAEVWKCIDLTLGEKPELFGATFHPGSDEGKQEFCDKLTAEFLHKLNNATLYDFMLAVDKNRPLIGFCLWKFALKKRSHIRIARGEPPAQKGAKKKSTGKEAKTPVKEAVFDGWAANGSASSPGENDLSEVCNTPEDEEISAIATQIPSAS